MTAARDLRGAFTQQELMTKFTRGLHRSVRAIWQEQRHDFTGPNALAEFADRATAIAESHSALTATRSRRAAALAVEEERITRRLVRMARPVATAADPVALADAYAPIMPPSRSPSVTADLEYSQYNWSTASLAYSRDTAPPEPLIADAVYLVFPDTGGRNANPRYRPGLNRPRAALNDICFNCYIEGHRSPDCPHKDRIVHDPPFLKWISENFHRLANWQRGWLDSIGRALGQSRVSPYRSSDPVVAAPIASPRQ